MNRNRSLLGVCQVEVSPKFVQLTAERLPKKRKSWLCFTPNATAYTKFGGGMIPNSSSELLLEMFKKNYTFSSRVGRTIIIMALYSHNHKPTMYFLHVHYCFPLWKTRVYCYLKCCANSLGPLSLLSQLCRCYELTLQKGIQEMWPSNLIAALLLLQR